jgi:hypothetical protein
MCFWLRFLDVESRVALFSGAPGSLNRLMVCCLMDLESFPEEKKIISLLLTQKNKKNSEDKSRARKKARDSGIGHKTEAFSCIAGSWLVAMVDK